MTTSTTVAPTLPTSDEIAAYHRDGFVVARGLLGAEVLDTAERGMRRFYAGERDAPAPGTTAYDSWDWSPAKGDVLRKNDYTSRVVSELAVLAEHRAIGAYAAALSGAAGIRLWHDQLLYKPTGRADAVVNVGWHTDRQYWTTCSSEQMLTAWVPFHDCDASMGTVTFVPGSHRWPAGTGLDFFDGDLRRQEDELRGRAEDVRFEAPALIRGDVTFHHCRTVHGSGPNSSGKPRRSMAIHLQPQDNVWVGGTGPDSSDGYHRNDELVRRVAGHPDYTDPALCPVLWP